MKTGNTVAGETLKTIQDVKHDYIVVDSEAAVNNLLELLSASSSFVFDTETAPTEVGSALEIHSLQLVGIAFCLKASEAFYIPIPEDKNAATTVLQAFKPFFENNTITKIGHNLKFDINVLRRYDINVSGPLYDTIIAHSLFYGALPHGLKDVSRSLLKYQQIEIEDLIGTGKHQTSLRELPVSEVAAYSCEDTDQTLQIAEALKGIQADKNVATLLSEVEFPIIDVLADMEYEGIKVDSSVLKGLEVEADKELGNLAQQIFTLAGIDYFNIGSNETLSEVLYDVLGLTPPFKTPTGANSVSKKALKKLENDHPIINLLLRYKATLSVRDNFLTKLPTTIHPKTHRVHTNFMQHRVVTGRLSSTKPNLQNIPNQIDGFGREIRKTFVPRDSNHVIVAADYSQIELRVMAHFSKDAEMLNSFRNDEDIHLATASRIFQVPLTDITKEDKRRKIAKTINFGLNYLMSAKTLAERISDATGEFCEVSTAQEYMDRYFDEFSGVKKYQQNAYLFAVSNDYCETLFGRRRPLLEINSPVASKRKAAKRLAVNTPIQGTAAEIIKKAMLLLQQKFKEQNLKAKMVLQVHDELVFDVPKEELATVMPVIKTIMEGVVELEVPLKVDIGHGENWLEAH